jgi:hypothetical protein
MVEIWWVAGFAAVIVRIAIGIGIGDGCGHGILNILEFFFRDGKGNGGRKKVIARFRYNQFRTVGVMKISSGFMQWFCLFEKGIAMQTTRS